VSVIKRLFKSETFWALLLIAGVTCLAYLPLLKQLGLIKEDWYLLWAGDKQGVQGIIASFQTDRPFAGYVYALFYPLLGNQPIGWHIASFALRLGGAYIFYWLVRMIWPREKMLAVAAALLFTVYPGYLQQPNAVNKMFWHSSWFASLLSLALTVYAVQTTSRIKAVLATLASLVLAAIYVLIIESYIGLEAVRLILIFYLVWRRERQALGRVLWKTFLYYLPYLLVVGGFLFWRFFIFESTRPSTDVGRLFSQYAETPLHMAGRVGIESIRDFIETTVLAWVVPFYQLIYVGEFGQILLASFLGLLAACLTFGFYWRFRQTDSGDNQPQPDTENSGLPWAWIVIGGLAVLLPMLPVILAGRQVLFNISTREDHYTLHVILGAVIFLVGLLVLMLRKRMVWVVVSLLVGAAIFTHYQNTSLVRDFWNIQKDVWWQLAWRAPQIEKGSLLFLNLPSGFAVEEGYEVWGPANFIYAPQSNEVDITGEVLDIFSAQDIVRGDRKPRTMRSFYINRRFGNSLILSMPTVRSCLHVIDGRNPQLAPEEDPLVRYVAPYSQIDDINPVGPQATLPLEIFGDMPPQGWCYYYQKAELAKQEQDWATAASLADEVIAQKLQPGDRTEWLPFVEAYIATGQVEAARDITENRIKQKDLLEYLCTQLNLNQAAYPQDQFELLSGLLCLEN
jgi:hypothetical protein